MVKNQHSQTGTTRSQQLRRTKLNQAVSGDYLSREEDTSARASSIYQHDSEAEHSVNPQEMVSVFEAASDGNGRTQGAPDTDKERLAAQVTTLTRLHELAMELAGPVNLNTALNTILQTMVELHGAKYGLLSLFDSSLGVLRRCCSVGLDESGYKILDQIVPGPQSGACGVAFSARKRVVIEDTETDPGFESYREFARSAGFRSVHSTPILTRGGEILGVLSVHFEDRRRPTSLEMQSADICARHAAEIIGFNKGQEALRESERRYREMIDALPAAIYTTDADGHLTHFNPAAVEFSGRVPELGTDQWCVSWKLYHPDGTPLPHDQCPMAIALKEGRVVHNMEAIAERPDGRRVYFRPYPAPLRDGEGRVTGGINMLVDITERRQAEEALHRSEEQFRAVFEQTTGGVAQTDLTGRFMLVNDRYCEIVGRSREELMNLRMQDITHPEDLSANVAQFIALAEGHGPNFVVQKRYVRPDGSHVWVQNHVSAILDTQGKVHCVAAAVVDITERKRAEEALMESERQLQILADSIPNLARISHKGCSKKPFRLA